MPGKVKVRIIAGRNLPVMDRSSDTSDAYVEIKLGITTFKTDVCRRSLNPHWNSEWFKFEVDDEELQDEPLQIRVMDYDTYSANDAIGKVYIDLSPLLLPRETGSVMSGWIPIYDTMHGIRGEVNVIIKVDLFSDFNRFRQSSCGVQFFCTAAIPHGYRAQGIHGFVEELVVNDDPEYQWIDKIRTPRASNEARQTLFSKLSGEVQRKIGLKALELGGNAVIGYRQCFDLEGESGIVVRGIGTAVTLTRKLAEPLHHSPTPPKDGTRESPLPEDSYLMSTSPVTPTAPKLSQSPAKTSAIHHNQQWCLSETDLSNVPKGLQYTSGGTSAKSVPRPIMGHESVDMLEYPFLSMTQFPNNFIVHLGGVVSARSVKLLGRINNPDEPETRDIWWTELRMEVRAHARALGCNVVLGYYETTSFCEDICVLSASGTAAIVQWHQTDQIFESTNLDDAKLSDLRDKGSAMKDGQENVTSAAAPNVAPHLRHRNYYDLTHETSPFMYTNCGLCHIPYSEASVPFPVNLVRCAICKKARVPDVLFTTIEPPLGIPIFGHGCLVQARVCRAKKDAKGEVNAKEISDSLPFLEYELHKQLLNKCKVTGMNALFGLRIQVSVGVRLLVAVATATGTYLSALPQPPMLNIVSGKSTDEARVCEMQQHLFETITQNRELYDVLVPPVTLDFLNGKIEEINANGDSSEDDMPELDLSSGNKDTCVLEVDDTEDIDFINLLIDPRPPLGFECCNTNTLPGIDSIACNLQMFIRVWRTRISSGGIGNRQFTQHFRDIMQSLHFKLRKMIPCVMANLQFIVDLPDDDELQISVLGMTVGIGEPQSNQTARPVVSPTAKTEQEKVSDMMFNMEDDHGGDKQGKEGKVEEQRKTQRTKLLHSDKRMPLYHALTKEKHGIDLTPLPYIPGAKIENYLGNLNFFFIRESTAIREVGGLSGFMHSFIAEVLAIIRAHVAALGGNALVSFFISECVLMHNPHKNQGQCLINVGGDVVHALFNITLQPVPSDSKKSTAASEILHASASSRHSFKAKDPKVSPLCVQSH